MRSVRYEVRVWSSCVRDVCSVCKSVSFSLRVPNFCSRDIWRAAAYSTHTHECNTAHMMWIWISSGESFDLFKTNTPAESVLRSVSWSSPVSHWWVHPECLRLWESGPALGSESCYHTDDAEPTPETERETHQDSHLYHGHTFNIRLCVQNVIRSLKPQSDIIKKHMWSRCICNG